MKNLLPDEMEILERLQGESDVRSIDDDDIRLLLARLSEMREENERLKEGLKLSQETTAKVFAKNCTLAKEKTDLQQEVGRNDEEWANECKEWSAQYNTARHELSGYKQSLAIRMEQLERAREANKELSLLAESYRAKLTKIVELWDNADADVDKLIEEARQALERSGEKE